MDENEATDLLGKGEYGVLGAEAPDGGTYTVPLNYCVVDGRIYFHCAQEGFKIECLKANPKVSFCVVGRAEVIPEDFTTLYESCIVHGAAFEAVGEEKRLALEGLISKYSADFAEEGHRYIDRLFDKTRVFGIAIDAITGKANRR